MKKSLPRSIIGGSNALPCPSCGKTKSAVIDGRPAGETFRRRRMCLSCEHRFNTYESATENDPRITCIRELEARVIREQIQRLEASLQKLSGDHPPNPAREAQDCARERSV